jgi:hypothetical protein
VASRMSRLLEVCDDHCAGCFGDDRHGQRGGLPGSGPAMSMIMTS